MELFFKRSNDNHRKSSSNVLLPSLTPRSNLLNYPKRGSLFCFPTSEKLNYLDVPIPSSNLLSVPSHVKNTIKSPLTPTKKALSPSIKSNRNYGAIHCYCANSNKGIFRDYNEDRVMIMLKIPKPIDRTVEKWPICSFFGLYDGHGGKACSNFLRDNLHLFITQEPSFPMDPCSAIKRGFEKAEFFFLAHAYPKKEKSGSCALVVLIVGKKCYIANLGDSRAVMSLNHGNDIKVLSKDHKPNEESERNRILNAGGEIFFSGKASGKGIARILPGRLSVSRAFGDIDAKLEEFGGNPNVLISIPDIKCVNIHSNSDFILLASDGIFDKISNEEAVQMIHKQNTAESDNEPLKKLTSGVENIITEAMTRESLDNLTVLAIGFENFF